MNLPIEQEKNGYNPIIVKTNKIDLSDYLTIIPKQKQEKRKRKTKELNSNMAFNNLPLNDNNEINLPFNNNNEINLPLDDEDNNNLPF
jgi:hypothetical protein